MLWIYGTTVQCSFDAKCKLNTLILYISLHPLRYCIDVVLVVLTQFHHLLNSVSALNMTISILVCCILIASFYCVSAFRMGTNYAVKSARPALCHILRMSSADQPIRERLSADMKEAMKSKEKIKLSSVRAILTAIKQKEVDDRVEVT